jgi:hypothetical protein
MPYPRVEARIDTRACGPNIKAFRGELRRELRDPPGFRRFTIFEAFEDTAETL